MKKTTILLVITLLVSFTTVANCEEELNGIPSTKMIHVYGKVTLDGVNAPKGTVIEAFDPDGKLCGRFVVEKQGLFGLMSIFGDDLATKKVDEGALPGEEITFSIDSRNAASLGDKSVTWQEDGAVIETALLVGNPDTTPPEVKSAKILSPIYIEVVFSEAVDKKTASDVANYHLENDIGDLVDIYQALCKGNPSVVTLVTNNTKSRNGYYLTVSEGITDFSSNNLKTSYLIHRVEIPQ